MNSHHTFTDLVPNESPHNYPLEWLDILITVFLNPERTDITTITPEQSDTLCTEIKAEETKLQLTVKKQVFQLSSENKIELLIRQYHNSITQLLDQSQENQRNSSSKKEVLKKLYKSLLNCLDGLLTFIENLFSRYLNKNERVPATYLSISKKEIRIKMDKLKLKIPAGSSVSALKDIVFKNLFNFINAPKLSYEVTYSTINYNKELVKRLEQLNWEVPEPELSLQFHEVLFYLNYNSRTYINHLVSLLEEELDSCESDVKRMDRLLSYYKKFTQSHRIPGLVFNPKSYDLDIVIGNWFLQEIYYLEKKLQLSSIPLQEGSEIAKHSRKVKSIHKVMCSLSSDQAALILRAADELRILIARSMNEVFRSIVPFLSTPYKEELSFDGMRSKSYNPEDRDKKIAIEALERMIVKIKGY